MQCDFAKAMSIRPDDSALVLGFTVLGQMVGSDDPGNVMALLEPDGALDPRFGTGVAAGRARSGRTANIAEAVVETSSREGCHVARTH